MFLHRILQLDETDPVWKTFVSMKSLHEAGENNWWTGVNKIVNKYGLSDLGKLKKATKDTFLKKVKRIIMESAFETLKAECNGMTKTKTMVYESFAIQDYFLELYPTQARVVFKWRSQTLDIKSHATHKFQDSVCRGCKSEIEDPSHIINCGNEEISNIVDVLNLGEKLDDITKSELKLAVSRITAFLDRIS